MVELRAELRAEAAARRAAEAAVEALRADVAALVVSQAAAPTALSSLPPALAREVLLRLPLLARARCACVCRAWRRLVMRDRALWAALDFSNRGGCGEFTSQQLLGAALRAGDSLRNLDVSGRAGVEVLALHRVLRYAPGLQVLKLGQMYRLVPLRPDRDHGEDDGLHDTDDWTPSPDDVDRALSLLPRGGPLRCVLLYDVECYGGDIADALARLRVAFPGVDITVQGVARSRRLH